MVVVLSQLLRHTDNLGNSLKKIIPILKRIILRKSRLKRSTKHPIYSKRSALKIYVLSMRRLTEGRRLFST